MRRTGCAWILLATLSGCVSFEHGTPPKGSMGHHGTAHAPISVPGVQGPYGTPVSMIPPYSSSPPSNWAARNMMNRSVPLNMVQFHGSQTGGITQAGATSYPGAGSGIVQASGQCPTCPPGGMPPPFVGPPNGMISPPGMPYAPGLQPTGGTQALANNNPYQQSGNQPWANNVFQKTSYRPPHGAVAAIGAMKGTHPHLRFPVQRTQVRFVAPAGMKISWYTRGADGKESYSAFPIEAPGRYNFLQAAVYRLKLTHIKGFPGLEIYPTLEVVPANPKTEEFLAHSPVPVTFTPEDFKQVASGNYLVKVVYLPDPQNQDLAFTGPDAIVSTQLEPGANPIDEARRRGNILLVIRMGSIDQEVISSPHIGDPGPNTGVMPQQGYRPHPGMPPPGHMVPFGMPQRPGLPAPTMPHHGPYVGNPGQVPTRPGQTPLPPRVPVPPQGNTPFTGIPGVPPQQQPVPPQQQLAPPPIPPAGNSGAPN